MAILNTDGWDRNQYEMTKNEKNVFEITLPLIIKHDTRVKISLELMDGSRVDRIPAWITRATQDLQKGAAYEGVFWNPTKQYTFKHSRPPKPCSLKIYEAHGKFKSL